MPPPPPGLEYTVTAPLDTEAESTGGDIFYDALDDLELMQGKTVQTTPVPVSIGTPSMASLDSQPIRSGSSAYQCTYKARR